MQTFTTAISQPDQPPPTGTRLTVFSGAGLEDIRLRNAAELNILAANYAVRYRTWIVPGLYVQDQQLWLSLFDETGALRFRQAATHLNLSWAGDLVRSIDLPVFTAPFAKIALVPDVDIYKGEVARIAALQGAEVIVSCQVIEQADYRREMILAGAWQQAQQNCLYVINSTNLNACIIGPCDTTDDHSGFLREITDEYPLTAELSAPKRAAAYRNFPIFKTMNPALYRHHTSELRK